MRKRWFKVVVIVTLILLPVGIYRLNWQFPGVFESVFDAVHRRLTDYPKEIRIAGGPERGEYHYIIKALKKEIETKLPVQVEIVPSQGSLENVPLLQAGEVDFALYTPGTLEEAKAQPGPRKVAFVANLFSQPAHFIVRRGAGIESPADLKGKRVHLGLKNSGDYAMSLTLLEHFNLKGSIKEEEGLEYSDLKQLFEDDKLDAAFITAGVHAKVFKDLAQTGKCDLIDIPNGDALAKKHLFTYPYTIPKGLYSYLPRVVPESNVETVAASEQLLTRTDVNATLVQEVIKILMDENFMRRNKLAELFAGGRDFAKEKPAFTMHRGARSVYDPEFDIHLIETGEAAYSLAVSTLIAVFFGFRWLKRRRTRRKEHKIDRFIRSLFDIEDRQAPLDRVPKPVHIEDLQKLLAEVTALRQEALREFTAHELSEDRGTDCFLEMCHALSSKINAKLSRQRLDIVMYDMIEAIRLQNPQPSDENTQTEDDTE